MNNSDLDKKIEICEKIISFSEALIKKEKPFDNLKLYPQFVSYLYEKYLLYYHEIDDEMKKKIIEEEINAASYLIKLSLGLWSGPSFNETFPDYAETRRVFETWVQKKEGEKKDYFVSLKEKEKIHVNKIIKEIISNKKQNFIYNKRYSNPSVIAYTVSSSEKNDTIILFDKGTYRDFISVYIGLDKPEFILDVANLFAGTQSCLEYDTKEKLEKEMDIAIEYIEYILPHFLKACSY